MVWAGVSWRGKTQIFFIDGWINNTRYVELLKRARRNILNLFPREFHFLQDNARPHVHQNSLRYIKRWLTPNLKDHPPQNPDLNPIELVWGRLKNLVEAKRPKNKQQLREATLESWEEIPMSFIRSYIAGLPAKIDKAIEEANQKLPNIEIESESEESDGDLTGGYDSLDDGYESSVLNDSSYEGSLDGNESWSDEDKY